MRAYWKLTQAGLRAFVRDRSALFWSFFFPLSFMLIFGLFFGDDNRGGTKFKVGLVLLDPSPAVAWVPEAFNKVPVFEIHAGSLDAETGELRAARRRAVIVFPADFGRRLTAGQTSEVKILYDPSQQQAAQLVTGIARQVIAEMDRRISGRAALLQAREEALIPEGVRGRRPRGMDFLIPGILGMMLMQLGLFIAVPIITMREKGILKRLSATALPRAALVGSQVTQRVLIGVAQTAVFLVIATALFHFRVAGSWVALFGVVVFGVLTFVAIGAVLSALAKTQEGGMPIVQLVNLLMMFLSSLFFPPELTPAFLRPVRDALPATHLADALRHVTLAAPSTYSMTLNLAVMGAWMLVSLLVAARIFRWE